MNWFWRRLEGISLWTLRLVLTAISRDMTRECSSRSCLILAPHADDETLGCGGLVLRKRAAGRDVVVVVASDGGASHAGEKTRELKREGLVVLRRKETLAACAVLGVVAERVEFYELPDGRLDTAMDDLVSRIEASLSRWSVGEIYVCAQTDGHRDHVALATAARAVVSNAASPAPVLYEYPVWFWDFRSWREPGRSNKAGFVLGIAKMVRTMFQLKPRTVRLQPYAGLKRNALAQHRSQLGELAEEPDWSGLPENFLRHFFGRNELFFEVDADRPPSKS